MSGHRWTGLLEAEISGQLWRARERLRNAWKWDQKDPKRYPINVSYVLAETKVRLLKQPDKINVKYPRGDPRGLAELIPEKLIETIFEEHHSDTFKDALKSAARVKPGINDESVKTFQGIIRAMEIAYLVHIFGIEFLPKPKVSILHRGLDQIAKAAGMEGLTRAGFSEFLDDLCPCGLRDHKEAVRKLSSRAPRIWRPKT